MSRPDPFATLRELSLPGSGKVDYYSLPALETAGVGPISRLPISLRIVLESVLRHCDGTRVTEKDVRALASWNAQEPAQVEIPFVVARIVLQDFTGVPLLVDLAAMRHAFSRMGKDPSKIEPLVPVDLVIDHSVQVDVAGTPYAFERNLEIEFIRNRERYEFLKWGQQAFKTFKVVPPGVGIVHQVNLEYLAKGVLTQERGGRRLAFPDTLVGTDSHTTMINGLGVVGWGVGGIEAEAGMLGQPVYFLTPEVVGVHLSGALREGVTATDLVLHITELLRRAKVVGKFVEFFGPGAASLSVPDRATIANMAPEYGATMGFFPVDAESVEYLRSTGRTEEECALFEHYFRAQGMFGMPTREDKIAYSVLLDVALDAIEPSVAGPKRPQDRIQLPELKEKFRALLAQPVADGGYGRSAKQVPHAYSVILEEKPPATITDGSVVIAAITSCTNTSNPTVMLAAGLLAKNAVERGLTISPLVKTSLAPGSRIVTDYLEKAGLQPYLDRLGFQLVGYGCTTCIGNSGPLAAPIEEAIIGHDIIAASVLSGNRNFEARVHVSVRANFLMSPPLVVAFALAGRVDIDLTRESLGLDASGNPVFLHEIWPTLAQVRDTLRASLSPESFRRLYRDVEAQNPAWNKIPAPTGTLYAWNAESTYIQEPPFFTDFPPQPAPVSDIAGARALAIFGDSITTDHISPAGSINVDSPAGIYLREHGVEHASFNSYGARRGNDRIMTRGTFANVRIKNQMVPDVEGGVTRIQPGGDLLPIYEAAMHYQAQGVPLIILAGREYGTGSSRDWAAKGTRLLGVRAVIAQSFERIHRSNLIGMGVLPCLFEADANAHSLLLDGTETFAITGIEQLREPRQQLMLEILRAGGARRSVPIIAQIETPIEIEYYRHGGILPYVLRQLAAAS